MKVNIKQWSRIGAWSMLVLIFLVSLGFAGHKQAVQPCKNVIVTVRDSGGFGFVEASDVQQLVHDKFGSLEGKPLGSINISLLEKITNTNPFISKAEVFSTVDGNIIIEVNQRSPIVRVINLTNESFYIDDQGVFMPLSEKYTARVPILSGYIFDRGSERKVNLYSDEQRNDTTLHLTLIDKLYHIAEKIKRNDFWKAEIEQLYVNETGDIELIPRVGNHTIVIGDDKDLDEKLSKLLLFYKAGIKQNGWNQYKVINLKFKDQVVATRN